MSTEKHIHRGTDRYVFDGGGGVREISKTHISVQQKLLKKIVQENHVKNQKTSNFFLLNGSCE